MQQSKWEKHDSLQLCWKTDFCVSHCISFGQQWDIPLLILLARNYPLSGWGVMSGCSFLQNGEVENTKYECDMSKLLAFFWEDNLLNMSSGDLGTSEGVQLS